MGPDSTDGVYDNPGTVQAKIDQWRTPANSRRQERKMHDKTTLFVLIVFSLIAIPAKAQIHDPRALAADPTKAAGPIAPMLKGLGDNHFPITTQRPESQQFFDQGLRLTYAFNHSEALRAFKEAARLDPDNAMAYWGWALVLGPNINLPMVLEVAPQAYQAIQRAVVLKDKSSERERAYIEALAKRYTNEPMADRTTLDQAYARAMMKVAKRYPDDLDAATLFAASLMNLSPWAWWNLDGSPKARTNEIVETLQSVVDRNPQHAGALHYYIHLVENHFPKRGERHADVLRGLMPGAGHIVHMPSHIYMRVGRYADSYEVNLRAADTDESYITQCRAQGVYPLNYYPHNIHFLAWSAMFQGRPKAALEAARKIVGKVPSEFASDGNVWALYEIFLSQPIFVMVRFGMWKEMLSEPKPDVESQFMTGIWHYGRALAYIHTGRLAEARRDLNPLSALRKAMGEVERYVSFTTGEVLLTIAEEIVLGELAYVEGNTLEGLARLERAVRLEDGLRYTAPPDWYFPVRHLLGAMLLDVGRPNEAEVIYAADLRNNPENGYSLLGLRLALEQQGNLDDALAVSKRFDHAWAEATHKLTSSRY
jgi:tetratricopeptide (TPR) repeat protein